MAFNIANFPAQLAQVIAAAKPTFQAGSTPAHFFGPISGKTVVGPDYTKTGRELEHLGDVMLQDKERRKNDALEFTKTIGSLQGPEKEFWNNIAKKSPQVQEKMKRFANEFPELFIASESGYDVLPQTASRQAYEEKEADIGYKKAATTNAAGEAEARQKKLPGEVALLSKQVDNLVEETLGRKLSNDEVQLSMQDKLRLLKAKVGTERATGANIRSETDEREQLLPGKVDQQKANIDLTKAQGLREAQLVTQEAEMHPLKKAYVAAQTLSEQADAQSKRQQRNMDYMKLQQKMENEAQDWAFKGWKAALDTIDATKQKLGRIEPYEESIANLTATYSLVGSFMKQSVQIGKDAEGNQIAYSVPGAVNNAGGRYAIDQTIDRVFENFEKMWQNGSSKNLEGVMDLADRALKLWEDTYGTSVALTDKPEQIEALLNGLQAMPEIVGEKNPTERYRDLYGKIVTMVLTADQLRPQGQKLVPLDDPLRTKYRAIPVPPGKIWGDKFTTYPGTPTKGKLGQITPMENK